jgi:hypothetical protein
MPAFVHALIQKGAYMHTLSNNKTDWMPPRTDRGKQEKHGSETLFILYSPSPACRVLAGVASQVCLAKLILPLQDMLCA